MSLNPWDVQSKHIQPDDGIAESLYSGECRYGGGESYVICIEGNGARPSHQGIGYSAPPMYTLNSTDVHCVAYVIGSYDSNAMKSNNPYSGIYEADTARTLDAMNCGYPACQQGGIAIVEIHQSGISPDGQPHSDSR